MNRRQVLRGIVATPLLPLIGKISYLLPTKKFDYSHIYISKEAVEDIKIWGCDHVTETMKREIYCA